IQSISNFGMITGQDDTSSKQYLIADETFGSDNIELGEDNIDGEVRVDEEDETDEEDEEGEAEEEEEAESRIGSVWSSPVRSQSKKTGPLSRTRLDRYETGP